MDWSPKRRWRVVVVALGLEIAIMSSLAVLSRATDEQAWKYLAAPLTMPGFVVTFLVGGGMSMVDGLAPAWLVITSLCLGFLVNAAVLYPFLLIGVSGYKELKLELERQKQ